MHTIFADFNAMTEREHVRLTCRGSASDIHRFCVQIGDNVRLNGGDFVVVAQVMFDPEYGLVGVPDWDTLVDLQEEPPMLLASVESTHPSGQENPVDVQPRLIKGLSDDESAVAWQLASYLPETSKRPGDGEPWKIIWEEALAALILELAKYLAARCRERNNPIPPAELRRRAARLRNASFLNFFARWERNALIGDAARNYGSRLSVYGFSATDGCDACFDALLAPQTTDHQVLAVTSR